MNSQVETREAHEMSGIDNNHTLLNLMQTQDSKRQRLVDEYRLPHESFESPMPENPMTREPKVFISLQANLTTKLDFGAF